MTLSLDTAYRSFGGEVEASSTPTICRLPDSRRHQLSAIAPACGAALVFGITHIRRAPPVETSVATAAPTVSPSASSARDESSAALARAQAEANAVAAELAVSPSSPIMDDSVPVFDIARI